ncbi:MAG: hypothetical protein CMJ50_09010, partial [Planctomycetaceae bacterium]|nr:hypothetical protein [Planctomycetaceae bacterium]
MTPQAAEMLPIKTTASIPLAWSFPADRPAGSHAGESLSPPRIPRIERRPNIFTLRDFEPRIRRVKERLAREEEVLAQRERETTSK